MDIKVHFSCICTENPEFKRVTECPDGQITGLVVALIRKLSPALLVIQSFLAVQLVNSPSRRKEPNPFRKPSLVPCRQTGLQLDLLSPSQLPGFVIGLFTGRSQN